MKCRLTALLLTAVLLLSGCWSSLEINDRGPVLALGIDRTATGKVHVIFSVAQPGASAAGKGQQGGKRKEKVVLQREGKTIAEVFRLVGLASSRSLELEHIRVVLLGERLANEGMDPVLDYLMRSPQVRLTARVFLVRGVSLQQLMESDPLMETLQADALRKMEATQTGLRESLKDLFIARASGYQAAVVPVVTMRSHPGTEAGAPGTEPELAGAAIFPQDRMTAYLSSKELGGVKWLRGAARRSVVTLECPGYPGQSISGQVARAAKRIRPRWDGRHLSFEVVLTGTIHITDVQCPINLIDTSVLGTLQGLVEAQVRQRVEQVLRRSQALAADPFYFGDRVQAMLPQAWEALGGDRWPQTWAKTPVAVSVQVRIMHVELTSAPPAMKPARLR